MILEQNKANIVTYGDVQQNKVSIDPRNAEHIISILSSNLYSNPRESFLRETICNAVDSHREAGTKEPIILLFKQNGIWYDIVIRDYGTGISPERFNQIYKFIGSSTKRDSNEYIGSFGIGRFASLAVADVVHITSYYNGTANVYVMAKNGGGIDIDLVSSFSTEEKNGVEIKITVKDIDHYIEHLNLLSYIPNLYVKLDVNGTDYYQSRWKGTVDAFNEKQCVKYNNFSINTFAPAGGYKEFWIVLGNVLYPVDANKVGNFPDYPDLGAYELSNQLSRIQILFEIGSLDVTPNREALLYSERTIKALREGVEAALNELVSLYEKQVANCDDILDFWLQIKRRRSLNLSLGDLKWNIVIDCVKVPTINSLFKGKLISKEAFNFLEILLYSGVDALPFKFITNGNGTLTSPQRRRLYLREMLYADRGYALNQEVKFIRIGSEESIKSTLVRSYAINKYKSDYREQYHIFLSNAPLTDWYEKVLAIRTVNKVDDTTKLWVFKELVRALKSKTITDDIENSEEFKAWKEERKERLKDNRQICVCDKPVIGYVSYNGISRQLEFKDLTEFNTALIRCTSMNSKERERPVLYGELHSPYWNIYDTLINYDTSVKFIVVKFAKNNMKYFKGISNKWIYIEDYLYKTKEFKQYLTYRKFKDPDVEFHNSGMESVVSRLYQCMIPSDLQAVKLCTSYYPPEFKSEDCEVLNIMLAKVKEEDKYIYDEKLKAALPIYYKYMRLAGKIENLKYSFNRNDMFAYFLMKHKLFRMNYHSYEEIKNLIKLTVK